MGRPWWYDSYWEKQQPRRRRPKTPSRRSLAWLAVVILSLFLALAGAQFHPTPRLFIALFVENLCRILSIAVLVRAIFSWFPFGGYNRFIMLLDDLTEPLLAPLRRVIPLIGRIDIAPLAAIVILSFIPVLVRAFIL